MQNGSTQVCSFTMATHHSRRYDSKYTMNWLLHAVRTRQCVLMETTDSWTLCFDRIRVPAVQISSHLLSCTSPPGEGKMSLILQSDSDDGILIF